MLDSFWYTLSASTHGPEGKSFPLSHSGEKALLFLHLSEARVFDMVGSYHRHIHSELHILMVSSACHRPV